MRDQLVQSAKSSIATVWRNSLRGLQFKKIPQMRGLLPDLDGVKYARPLKVIKTKRF
jgi:hypothetical protein